MKYSSTYIQIILLAIGLSTLVSCKKDDPIVEETQEEIFLDKISGDWKTSAVTLDGMDVSKSFPGLGIVITEAKQITVTNAVPPIWKGTGTFTLQPVGSSYQLKRDDGVLMTVTQPTDKKLLLKFQYDAAAFGGRTKSVKGEFTFEFSAN
jgi:hypothetical protein